MSERTEQEEQFESEQAERFDEALDRALAGDAAPPDDPELAELVELALRLDQNLPEDLPDPSFRERLGRELTGDQPINLDAERQRRFSRFSWPVGAIAAVVAILLVGLIINWEGTTERTGTSQPEDTGITAMRDEVESESEPEPESGDAIITGETETATFADRTIFPPLSTATVIEPPFAMGSAGREFALDPLPETPDPDAEPGLDLAVDLPDLPETAVAWRLSAPPDPETFMDTVRARLGLTDAEIVGQDVGDGRFYSLVNEAGIPFVRWDQETAFFDYTGHPELRTPPPERPETDPEETARHWLEEVGFDVVTIEYETSVQTAQDLNAIHFEPANLPEGEIEPGLGMTVGVTSGGAIQFAYGYWLSLEELGEVQLRTAQEAWDALQAGEGYWPVMSPQPNGNIGVTFDDVSLGWILTHADDGAEVTFLLHPVVIFSGMTNESEPLPAEVFVSAVPE